MMIKKIATIIVLALTYVGVNAQLPVGGWRILSPFTGVTSMAETNNYLYYTSSGSLFSVDKDTREVRTLNSTNSLNGAKIKEIYRHPQGKYLIVTYQDCNIDRINDDGTVINISDIKDANLTGSPSINGVGFGNGRIYVATSFGLVTINEKTNTTIESMFAPAAVNRVYGLGDKVLIHYNGGFHTANASDHLVNIDRFTPVSGSTSNRSYQPNAIIVGSNRLIVPFYSGTNLRVDVMDFNFENNSVANSTPSYNLAAISPLNKNQAILSDGTRFYIYTPETPLNSPTQSTLPSILKGQVISAFEGLDQVWAGNADGVNLYDISDPSSPVQIGEKFGQTAFATPGCNRLVVSSSGKIYFLNVAEAYWTYAGFSGKPALRMTIYDKDNGFTTMPGTNSIVEATYLSEDPTDPSILYISTFRKNGIYRVNHGEIDAQFTADNSTIFCGSFAGLSTSQFDNYGNFWAFQEDHQNQINTGNVIKGSDLRKTRPQPSDWKKFQIRNLSRTSRSCALPQSNMLVIAKGYWDNTLNFVFINGPSMDDDQYINANTFIDQDNRTLAFNHIWSLSNDKKGRLWVGTDKGIFEITDPTKATSEVVYVNHLKVPRNDGTGLADYLLDTEEISAIAVDNSNRKWIGTLASGVFLVSEDGDQIIEHFNNSNSPLPSDKVWDIACDPKSSSVFFVTDAGVVEYNSNSAPGAENLDEVIAYPNPVRPDYTGWITISGLMDNTLVKIADAAGNVFYQGRSEGGLLTWDGCNANGDRVKTGVYYVFASTGASGQKADSCVTKIMVIN